MRAVIQRVSEAKVQVNNEIVSQIERGVVILLGVSSTDTLVDANYLSEKIVHLRIFPNDAGKFAFSLLDVDGQALIVSQFTLYGDCHKGRRPSFTDAAGIDKALPLYEYFVECVRQKDVVVATGRFQTTMTVQLVNDGPVTLLLDTEDRQERAARIIGNP